MVVHGLNDKNKISLGKFFFLRHDFLGLTFPGTLFNQAYEQFIYHDLDRLALKINYHMDKVLRLQIKARILWFEIHSSLFLSFSSHYGFSSPRGNLEILVVILIVLMQGKGILKQQLIEQRQECCLVILQYTE